MKAIEKLNNVNKNIWFIIILIFSSVFYLYNINFSNIWIDEAFTKALVRLSFGEITNLIKSDFHPPLYFYVLKIFVTVFGDSDFTIRLFSEIGTLATIVIGYLVGQKIFGKSGALYLCLLVLSLPMLTQFSHEARMYSWGAFTVTGTFLYAVIFITSDKRRDLLFLMFFSLLAAYTHYYALVASFWANMFVFIFLLIKKNKNLKIHALYSLIAFILYVPWLLVMLDQAKSVSKSFWVPSLSWKIFSSCLLNPFAPIIYLTPYLPLAFIIYALLLLAIYRNFISRKDKQGLVLGLSLCMFWCTILTAIVVSVLMQPILFIRYISVIVVMLLIPAVLFFTTVKNKWIKGSVLVVILYFGISVSIEGTSFSYGPYEQSINYLHEKHPDVKKVFHIVETTAGPLTEYSRFGIQNYWYNPSSTIVYTNMDVFKNLIKTNSLGKVLKTGEPFCLVSFPFMPFNDNNLKQALSESRVIEVDTVVDNKVQYGSSLFLNILEYKGNIK